MDTGLGLRPSRGLSNRRGETFLSPLSPQRAARELDEALNGKAPANPLFARTGSGEFRGAVQGPSFWVSTRTAAYNPLERHLHGVLDSVGGTTEVRWELRTRPAAYATVYGSAATAAGYTIVAVPVGLLAGDIPVLGHLAGAVLISVAVALWVLLAAGYVAGRALARQSEERTAEFVATVLRAFGGGVD